MPHNSKKALARLVRLRRLHDVQLTQARRLAGEANTAHMRMIAVSERSRELAGSYALSSTTNDAANLCRTLKFVGQLHKLVDQTMVERGQTEAASLSAQRALASAEKRGELVAERHRRLKHVMDQTTHEYLSTGNSPKMARVLKGIDQ